MAVNFHTACRDDLPKLLLMMKELQQDDPWSLPFNEAETVKVVDDLVRDPSLGRIWIITSDGENVGYIVMTFDYSLEYGGRGAWVDELFVRRSHRCRGIGSQALEFFAHETKQLGATVIHLEVTQGNPAIELYRRLGFEDHHRYLMTKRIGETS
jgi:diamine N-acetyltransferase